MHRRQILQSLLCLPVAAHGQNSRDSSDTRGTGNSYKVLFVYIGPIGITGWSYSHEQARLKLEATASSEISTVAIENVATGDPALAIFREAARRGFQHVFATVYGYKDAVKRAAAEYPNIRFEIVGAPATASNIRTYSPRTYEGAFLAGMLAASVAGDRPIGVIGSIPVPEVVQQINAFALGAQSVAPKIRTRLDWVNSMFNPSIEGKVASQLFADGAEVVFQTTDSFAPLRIAERVGKKGIGIFHNMSEISKAAHLGSVAIDWSNYYRQSVRAAMSGTWTNSSASLGIADAVVDLVGLPETIPSHVVDAINEARTGILRGTKNIWVQDLRTNLGDLALPNGRAPNSADLREMYFLVSGIEGALPSM